MDQQETIKKLEELAGLMDKFTFLQPYIEGGCVGEYGRKKQELCRAANVLPSVPDVCVNLPVIPAEVSQDFLTAEADVTANAKKSKYALIAAAVVFALMVIIPATVMFFTYVCMGCLIAAVVFSSKKSKAKKIYDEGKAKFDAAEKLREKTLAAFRNGLAVYDRQREIGVNALAEHAARYEELQKEWYALDEECRQKLEQAQSLSDRCVGLIQTYDFVPTEYLHLVKPMIGLLKSGRADDYKEALNMAIAEEREEEERQARMAAEQRRIELEERRAEEERRHNERMEAQQRAHDQQMERQAAQAEHDRRVAEKEAQRAANKARFESRRCHGCAHFGKCTIRRTEGAYNCTGFTPR